MDDPTSILQEQLNLSPPKAEEQKAKPEQKPSESAQQVGFMALAAEEHPEPEKKQSDGNMARDELAYKNQLHNIQKHKSHTPMPMRKRSHANSAVAQHHHSGRPFVLAICGGPSSGMSTVAKNISTELERSGIKTVILDQNRFYVPIRGNLRKNRSRAGSLVEEEKKEEVFKEIAVINERTDFDNPEQIDFDLLIRAVDQLKMRKPFNLPIYDKVYKIRMQSEEKVTESDVIIVEGALIFCNEDLRKMYDLSIYIDTDDDVRLSRRVLKNAQAEEDQRVPLAELLKTYENKTKPAFEKHIEPCKKYANIIIPNYGFSPNSFQLDQMTIQGVDVVISDLKTNIQRRQNSMRE